MTIQHAGDQSSSHSAVQVRGAQSSGEALKTAQVLERIRLLEFPEGSPIKAAVERFLDIAAEVVVRSTWADGGAGRKAIERALEISESMLSRCAASAKIDHGESQDAAVVIDALRAATTSLQQLSKQLGDSRTAAFRLDAAGMCAVLGVESPGSSDGDVAIKGATLPDGAAWRNAVKELVSESSSLALAVPEEKGAENVPALSSDETAPVHRSWIRSVLSRVFRSSTVTPSPPPGASLPEVTPCPLTQNLERFGLIRMMDGEASSKAVFRFVEVIDGTKNWNDFRFDCLSQEEEKTLELAERLGMREQFPDLVHRSKEQSYESEVTKRVDNCFKALSILQKAVHKHYRVLPFTAESVKATINKRLQDGQEMREVVRIVPEMPDRKSFYSHAALPKDILSSLVVLEDGLIHMKDFILSPEGKKLLGSGENYYLDFELIVENFVPTSGEASSNIVLNPSEQHGSRESNVCAGFLKVVIRDSYNPTESQFVFYIAYWPANFEELEYRRHTKDSTTGRSSVTSSDSLSAERGAV